MQTIPRSIVIGGAAGQGLQTIGDTLVKVLVRSGYEVLVAQHYMSRVRGGQNSYHVRVGVQPVLAPTDAVHILIALDQEIVAMHGPKLGANGVVILDDRLDPGALRAVRIPFTTISSTPRYENTAAVGVLGAFLGVDRTIMEAYLAEAFAHKGDAVVQDNLAVLDTAWAWALRHNDGCEPLPAPQGPNGRMAINGNEAIALGALAAGVKFCSFYPMTPASSIANAVIAHSVKLGVVVEQAEDEIAAVNMALGATYAGVKAMVPTSGGGFALMTEGVSLAGAMELPLVIALAQRPGPATGLPTRTEQADLELALHAGHGEFPRIILAPATAEDCFHLTYTAYDLSERYQVPVFILTDQYLADCYSPMQIPDPADLPVVAGPDFTPGGGPRHERYKRYAITESGISPRKVPGFTDTLVLSDSHAHTEQGFMCEDKALRAAMVDKQLRKATQLAERVIPPRRTGDAAPELLLVCWGSTEGAVLEAAALLRADGHKVGVLSFTQVWPLDAHSCRKQLADAGEVVFVEGNATGQFERLLAQAAGCGTSRKLLRYDGRPITPEWIVRHLRACSIG